MTIAPSSRASATPRIGVLAPMPNELAPLIEPLGLVRSDTSEHGRWHGTLGGMEIVAMRTGIGMSRLLFCQTLGSAWKKLEIRKTL